MMKFEYIMFLILIGALFTLMFTNSSLRKEIQQQDVIIAGYKAVQEADKVKAKGMKKIKDSNERIDNVLKKINDTPIGGSITL